MRSSGIHSLNTSAFLVTYQFPRTIIGCPVGDLSVQDVVGDKDLELTGGDLTIQVGSPEDYSHVDLSVKFGDISGSQFGDPKGWIGNSLQKDGNGKYKLHAHVMAGNLVLKS